jgi:hypothetical protein
VASATAVRAPKTLHGYPSPSDFLGKRAFSCLIAFHVKRFFNFCLAAVKQVVYVPEKGLLFSEVTQNPLFQVRLCGANVNVGAFLEVDFAFCANFEGDILFERIMSA